jgi:acetoin utilization deacetylase AcuC-like enzyme
MEVRDVKIKTFYSDNQVLKNNTNLNYSKSPAKPKLLIEYLETHGLIQNFELIKDFEPFSKKDFYIAHEKSYVDEFFSGKGRCDSNGLAWSKQFAESIRYTNSSLYLAIKNSIINPREISFSPTSGFHHAKPQRGSGFCTFSGQVIASIKIYKEFGLSGAYFDLDGHFGNSIEDSRDFVKDLNSAIPIGFNINPTGKNKSYIKALTNSLKKVKAAILSGKIHYVVWCHGADSHELDDLGGQCSTENWLECSKIFWKWVKEMDSQLGRPLPVSCSLFGGYRSDDYSSVLSLHTSDLVVCLNEIMEIGIDYKTCVKTKNTIKYSLS